MRRQSLLIQLGVGAVLMAGLGVLINNLTVNLIRTGIDLGFDWLKQPAGFALAETALPYAPSDSYLCSSDRLAEQPQGRPGWAGAGHCSGITAGRASVPMLLRGLTAGYVAVIRQVPLLLQLLFWYFVAFLACRTRDWGDDQALQQGIHLGLNLRWSSARS